MFEMTYFFNYGILSLLCAMVTAHDLAFRIVQNGQHVEVVDFTTPVEYQFTMLPVQHLRNSVNEHFPLIHPNIKQTRRLFSGHKTDIDITIPDIKTVTITVLLFQPEYGLRRVTNKVAYTSGISSPTEPYEFSISSTDITQFFGFVPRGSFLVVRTSMTLDVELHDVIEYGDVGDDTQVERRAFLDGDTFIDVYRCVIEISKNLVDDRLEAALALSLDKNEIIISGPRIHEEKNWNLVKAQLKRDGIDWDKQASSTRICSTIVLSTQIIPIFGFGHDSANFYKQEAKRIEMLETAAKESGFEITEQMTDLTKQHGFNVDYIYKFVGMMTGKAANILLDCILWVMGSPASINGLIRQTSRMLYHYAFGVVPVSDNQVLLAAISSIIRFFCGASGWDPVTRPWQAFFPKWLAQKFMPTPLPPRQLFLMYIGAQPFLVQLGWAHAVYSAGMLVYEGGRYVQAQIQKRTTKRFYRLVLSTQPVTAATFCLVTKRHDSKKFTLTSCTDPSPTFEKNRFVPDSWWFKTGKVTDNRILDEEQHRDVGRAVWQKESGYREREFQNPFGCWCALSLIEHDYYRKPKSREERMSDTVVLPKCYKRWKYSIVGNANCPKTMVTEMIFKFDS